MIVDLVGPSQDAFFAALHAVMPKATAKVLVTIPQGTEPNFVLVGAIDSEPDLSILEQLEKITVEIQYVYRGQDRGVLVDMMRIGREALDQQPLTTPAGVEFGLPRCSSSSIGTAGPDGVTYAGIQNFEFLAQPA